MSLAPVTEDEKSRARHHMGYLQVEAAQTFVLGIPAAVQTQVMIEGAIVRILLSAYPKFQQLLCRLDEIENQIMCGLDMIDINRIDAIEINRNRLKEYAQIYCIQRSALGNLMGIIPNFWDQRSWVALGEVGGLNVSVSH